MSQVEADAGSAHELSEQPVGFHATFPEIKTNSEMNLVATSLSVQPLDKEDKPDGEMEPSDAISNTEDTPNGEVQSSDPSDVVMEPSDVIPNNGNHGASDTAEDEVETTGISFEGMQLHEPDNTYVEKEIPQNSEQEDTSEGVNEHDGLSNGVHASDIMSLAALLENDRIRDLEILKSTSEDSRYSSSLESVHSSNLEETVLGRSLNKPKVEITDTNRNQSYSHQSPSRVSIAEDVLGSIASNEEEGRSRQRILSLAAKRYANAVERNPDDFDALYNWALVLQESADSMGTDCSPSDKDGLLEEACKKYEAATNLCPTLHEAFYNWGIAISDRAKIRGRTKEAENLWKQACEKYERSVQLNWASPQALNNWGLALQELGAIVPLKEKRAIVRTAIKKFRAAIHLRFDFHRAIYNLGTVLYGLAEDTLRSGRRIGVKEEAASDLYSQSAVYIASAHSLKPEYPVYRSALRLVRSMLPLPYLKVGYLTVPPKGDSLAPHCDWKRLWFVLDHESLYECEKSNLKSSSINTEHSSLAAMREPELKIEMHDVSFISPCADLSLPAGGGFCIETSSGQYYMVVDSWEAVDSWVDALRLVYTICVRGKSDALAGVLAG